MSNMRSRGSRGTSRAAPRRIDWKPEEREKFPLRPGFKRNLGDFPRGGRGKSVTVALMTGDLVENGAWRVETTRWTLTGDKFDVDQYKIV